MFFLMCFFYGWGFGDSVILYGSVTLFPSLSRFGPVLES